MEGEGQGRKQVDQKCLLLCAGSFVVVSYRIFFFFF